MNSSSWLSSEQWKQWANGKNHFSFSVLFHKLLVVLELPCPVASVMIDDIAFPDITGIGD